MLQKVLAEEEKRKQKSTKCQNVKEKAPKPRKNAKGTDCGVSFSGELHYCLLGIERSSVNLGSGHRPECTVRRESIINKLLLNNNNSSSDNNCFASYSGAKQQLPFNDLYFSLLHV